MPENLGVDTFPNPVGHFGAHWRPFWILQAVRRCRRWASAPFAARLVLLYKKVLIKTSPHCVSLVIWKISYGHISLDKPARLTISLVFWIRFWWWDDCRNPLRAGVKKVEAKLSDFLGTKLVGNGNDWLVLPRTLKFICSKLVFTKIHHKVTKNVFIVRSWLTYSFRGKSYQASWQGFVSEHNWISFSLKIGILVSQLTSFRRKSWQASWQGNKNANFQREWNPILLQNNSLSIWLSWFPPKWVSESAPLTLKMFLDTLWWSFVNTSC